MITASAEGKLLRWYDDVGAMVEQGDVIAEIQTEVGSVPVLAPQAGRLTEMMALAEDGVQAGQAIGRIDVVEVAQPLGALIDPPTERKLKPKETMRKPRPVLLSSTARWAVFGVAALVGVSALMVLFVVPVRVVEVPVAVTAPPLPPMPTPRFRIRERVLLQGQVGVHTWGEQGVVQNMGYEPGSGTWYDVQFGKETLRLGESQLEDLGSLAPTPTMQLDARHWDWSYPLMLKEPVADFPAGTRVTIGSAMFNGVEYELQVVTENGVGLTVREAQLEAPPDAPANPATTPIPMWSNYVGQEVYAMMTNQYIGNIPPSTRVRLTNLWFANGEWVYTIVTEGSLEEYEARESQLSPAT
jgi:pyruvate/2-oxoglutarate dehydrogenase complex dihydrolipoamide acyltransferase (E2) component